MEAFWLPMFLLGPSAAGISWRRGYGHSGARLWGENLVYMPVTSSYPSHSPCYWNVPLTIQYIHSELRVTDQTKNYSCCCLKAYGTNPMNPYLCLVGPSGKHTFPYPSTDTSINFEEGQVFLVTQLHICMYTSTACADVPSSDWGSSYLCPTQASKLYFSWATLYAQLHGGFVLRALFLQPLNEFQQSPPNI